MSNYADILIDNYKKKLNLVQTNMNTRGIFPDRTEPLKFLDSGSENILKTIFRLRVCFLEELTILFSFCYSKQKFESLIIDLEEKQGYIQSQTSKDYGKYFILTPKALYYLYTDRTTPYSECNISEDKFPKESKLIMHKCINGIFSEMVFKRLTEAVWSKYQQQDKDFRKLYARKQFLKNFVYDKGAKAYKKEEAEAFALSHIHVLNNDTELFERFKRFAAYMKEHPDDEILRFNYLKDFYNSLRMGREKALDNTMFILNDIFSNIYRDKFFTYRNTLYNLSNKSSKLKDEFTLFTADEFIRILGITRRSLLNTQKATKSEEELSEILKKIDDLDRKIEQLQRIKANLEEQFEVMVFDKIGANDCALFTPDVITFESLKNLNVYITSCTLNQTGKYCLEFSIVQPTSEEVAISYLFSRIEAIHKFYRNNLLMFDYRIKIVTYTPKQKELLETKLATVREDFEMIPEYAMLLLTFDEAIEVVSTKRHFRERYEVFNDIKKYV